MSQNRTASLDGINTSEKTLRDKALRALALVKEREKKEGVVAIRVDEKTIKLIPKKKAIKLGLIKN